MYGSGRDAFGSGMMNIRFAVSKDIIVLGRYDEHISKSEMENAIRLNRIYIVEEEGHFAGWLRYNLFWDNTPFMNLLYILEKYQGRGFGRQLTAFWEKEMESQGFGMVMTSTQSDEYAQHFYFRLGYTAIGGFLWENDPYEVIFAKKLPAADKVGPD